jgi:hypothetical protein
MFNLFKLRIAMSKEIPIKDLKKGHEYISDGIPTGVHSYIGGIHDFRVKRVTEKAIQITLNKDLTDMWILKRWDNINIVEDITGKWNY